MRIYALNITAMSLRGKLAIGLVGCPDLLPDLWEMADEFAVGWRSCSHTRGSFGGGAANHDLRFPLAA